MADQATIALYDQQSREYAAAMAKHPEDPHLAAFIKDIPTGGRVLDLGCGPGQAAGEMAKAGLLVDATDAAAAMVEMARHHSGVTAWKATFDEIEGEDLYDGIWANFSLLHAARSDMPRHLDRIARALRPAGRFHIGLKTGRGEKRDKIGRRYTYYSEAELKHLVEAAGLHVTDAHFGSGVGLDGELADWVVLYARG